MLLSPKQIRMLELLDEQVQSCQSCVLYYGGRCKPFWTKSSKYAILGEAPGGNEVKFNEPFYGPAGTILWEMFLEHGIHKDEFVIVNSVNCRPYREKYGRKSNAKPLPVQQDACRMWYRKYFKVVKPKKMLVLGNYAMGSLLGEHSGIMRLNALQNHSEQFDCPFVLSVHPALCIYRKEEGLKLLKESIKVFKSIGSYDFLEDDELWKM